MAVGKGSGGLSSYTLRTYLNNSGTKMYATVYFTQKEEQDGYQYIQILADNSTTYDGNDPNGAVNTPSTSLYKACFILSYDPSGSVETNPHTQFFPHRWDYADRNAQYSGNGWSWQEFDYDNAHLYEQEFKSATPSLRAENSGSLVLAPSVNNINVCFDAAGSGGDDWYFKDLKVRLALVDATAPTVLNNYKVSGGRHQKGNLIYVSVPFSELVTVEGTPTLTTTWGTLSYYAGSGSNVLTFSGAIGSDASGTLSVSALSGTVRDLAGNAFSGTVSKDFGISLDATYEWSLSDLNQLAANTYEIATKTDLYRLADIVNVSRNECEGITLLQTQDIVCDAGYTPIGYQGDNDHSYFRGTYDGQGHTVSGITVTRTGNTSADKYIGLFGYVYQGTVQNVVLANSTFTGYRYVGGIAGEISWGTVRNCRVESSVTIKVGNSPAENFGGVVGYFHGSGALMTGCVSAATIENNGLTCNDCGGISGDVDNCTLKDCLYIGTSVTATGYVGSIAGDKTGVTLSNNYYTAISLGGVGAYTGAADQDGARRARTVTLSEGITLDGTETTYDVSGITAYGSTAIGYGGKIYSGEGQTLTLSYTVPEGYTFDGFSVNGTAIDGNSFTMSAKNVTVGAILTKNELALANNSSNDEAIAAAAASGKVYEVTLTDRTLYKDGAWNTLCLPFDVDLSDSPLNGATAKALTAASISGTTLYLTFSDAVTELEAGTPYIIKWETDTENSAIVSPVFSGVQIQDVTGNYWNDDRSVAFMGTYAALVDITSQTETGYDVLLMGGDNTLRYAGSGASLGACRAYFLVDPTNVDSQAARLTSFNIDFSEGEATGVKSIADLQWQSESWYTLDGRKVNDQPKRKGIYVNKGKKVIIK